VYTVGDTIVLDNGYRLNLKETSAVCMHSLASILPYYNALAHGVDPAVLGLADSEGRACLQCLDPCHLTGGGTVVFRVVRQD
ncbi:MAG: TIGR04076 family protein, partial [Gemmatimonadales bacterium]|nr:TIGR04076 family protein [Gemmatimonadales bacterium]